MSDDVVALRPRAGEISPVLRRIPHNVDAEMAVLGGIMLDRKVWDKVGDFLKPEHFIIEGHGLLFRRCQYQIERGR